MTTTAMSTLYGVFRTGALRMALPLEQLREVIVRPAEFSALPSAGTGLLGAVNLRHIVIPVIDPCLLAGQASAAATGQVIIIVSSDGRLFGLLADAIEGSTHVAAESLLAVHVGGGGPALFSHTFERAEDQAVIALLDAATIVDMPGIPAVTDPAQQPGTVTVTAGHQQVPGRTLLMFECDDTGMSIDVTHVHSVVPDLHLQASPLDGPICRGVAHLAGHAVPAIDPVTLLGLGEPSRPRSHRGVVVSLPQGLIALAVSEITEITTVSADDILPVPVLSGPDRALLAGLLTTDGRQYLVLDGQALRNNTELAAFGALNMQLGSPRAGAGSAPPEETAGNGPRIVPNTRTFLTYRAGVEAATVLEQIDEILPFPDVGLRLDAAPVIGMFTHRRKTIPLVNLAVLLGRGHTVQAGADRVLLVTLAGGPTVGLVVPELRAIEQSLWEEPEGDVGGGRDRRLVSIGTPDDNRLLPEIDLIGLVTQHFARNPVGTPAG